jgi:hypothetical protein
MTDSPESPSPTIRPAVDGLPAILTYKGKGPDETFLLLALEIFTDGVWRGRAVAPETYTLARKIIMRAKGMEEALDSRLEKMGVEK